MDDCCAPRDPSRYDDVFDARFARKLAREYERRGPSRAARRILDFATSTGLAGATVLEVGGGIGDIQLELLERGAAGATNLELSSEYEVEAARLLDQAGLAGRASRMVGVDIAATPDAVAPADIVVLNRVVCCYPDYERLLAASTSHARRAVVFSHPPRNLVARALNAVENAAMRLTGRSYRSYLHPPEAMLAVVTRSGFTPRYRERAGLWTIVGAVRD